MTRRSLLALLLSVVVTVGCGPFNPIAPIGLMLQIGVYWLEGEAHKYYNADQATVHQATKNVLNELGFPISKDYVDSDTIHMVAGDQGKDKFKIKIRNVRYNITELSIRINTFGDKPYAELIYRNVDKQAGIKVFHSVRQLEDTYYGR